MVTLGILLSVSRGAWLGLAVSLGIMALAWSARARALVVPLAGAFALFVGLALAGMLQSKFATPDSRRTVRRLLAMALVAIAIWFALTTGHA